MPLPPSEFKCNCSPRTMTVFRPGTLVSETFTVTGNQITARNILGLWGPYSSSWEMSSTRDQHGALGQGRSHRWGRGGVTGGAGEESQGELLVPGLLRVAGRPAKVFCF